MKKSFLIISTTAVFWVLIGLFYVVYDQQIKRKKADPQYAIQKIAIRSCTLDHMPESLLWKLLNIEEHASLYTQSNTYYEKQLLRCPAISSASVFLIPPDTLGVEYRLKDPVAYLGRYENLAIDGTGSCFFLYPYFVKKRLPVLDLGFGDQKNIEDLQEKLNVSSKVKIGLYMIDQLHVLSKKTDLFLEDVDLSLWDEENYFRKEVVCTFAHMVFPDIRYYVRISPQNMQRSIKILKKMLPKMITTFPKGGICDIRFENKLFFLES